MGLSVEDGWAQILPKRANDFVYEYRIGGIVVALIQPIKKTKQWGVTYKGDNTTDILFRHADLEHCKNTVEHALRTAIYNYDFSTLNSEER